MVTINQYQLYIILSAYVVIRCRYMSLLYERKWCKFISIISNANYFCSQVFFILRKKQSHVTFLHVYHHANMVLSTWAYLKYIKGTKLCIYLFNDMNNLDNSIYVDISLIKKRNFGLHFFFFFFWIISTYIIIVYN